MSLTRLRSRRAAVAGIVLGLFSLSLFWAAGWQGLQHFSLDLGSITFPRPRHLSFLALWGIFGSIAIFGFTLALRFMASPRGWRRVECALARIPPRKAVLLFVALGLLGPLLVRTFLLEGAVLSDDESIYRFQAQLLASGRLVGTSHPLKIFFDHVFLINDGTMYGQYFIGWPLLLAPGALIHSPELMNPLYTAATLPAIHLVARRNGGPLASAWSMLFFLASPMVLVGGATLESHTSVIFALAWGIALVDRCRFQGISLTHHAGAAAFFCLAFFIRPQVVVPLALPFVVLWASHALRAEGRTKRLLAFVLPTVILAGLFLAVLWVQTGSPFKPPYLAYLDYARSNSFRFSLWWREPGIGIPNLRLHEPLERLAVVATGIFRANFALLGWPSAFVILPLAWGRHSSTVKALFSSVGLFVAFALVGSDAGIDAFGPVHWTEIILPVVLLSGIGLARVGSLFPAARDWRLPLLIALLGSTAMGYLPVRMRGLSRLAEVHLFAERLLDRAGIERALVFSPWPFTKYCGRPVAIHGHKFWHPMNDPALENPRIFVNDLGPEENARLLPFFPERKAVRLVWQADCRLVIEPVLPGPIPTAKENR